MESFENFLKVGMDHCLKLSIAMQVRQRIIQTARSNSYSYYHNSYSYLRERWSAWIDFVQHDIAVKACDDCDNTFITDSTIYSTICLDRSNDFITRLKNVEFPLPEEMPKWIADA